MAMTQEEKYILLKDLCTRLSNWKWNNCVRFKEGGVLFGIKGTTVLIQSGSNGDIISEYDVEEIHPYLRPMSSMTDEEKKEAKENGCIIYWDTSPEDKGLMIIASQKGFDWLNKKMFDYHKDDKCKTMIEKGLALEASEGMYN